MTALGMTLAVNNGGSLGISREAWLHGADVPMGMAGAEVTPDLAMSIAAVYACVTVIAETIAAAPLHMFELVGDDGKRVSRDHPLEELLHDQPNEYQTAIEFREMMTAFALLRGRGVARIKAGPRGPVDQLEPLHPDLVRKETTRTGQIRYRYRNPLTHETEVLLPDDVFVVTGRYGRSVLDYARTSFAIDIAMQRWNNDLYQRGVRAAGALQHPKTLSDKARTNLREALDEYALGGDNAGRPLLLEEGMEWKQITITNKDAEFLANRTFQVAEVARWFRVPPHKIGDLSEATFSNIEKQAIEFITDCLTPWAERWEQSIRRDLILAKARFFAEHNLDGLLRGDIKTRYEAYAIGRQWGWLSTNDIRRKENENPVRGGDDDYLTPLNMTTGAQGTTVAFAPRPEQTMTTAYLRSMVRDAAARVVRRETAALAKLAERHADHGSEWRDGVKAFYGDHAEFVASLLHVELDAARQYAVARCTAVLDAADTDESEVVTGLSNLALEQAEVLRLETAA